jgi:hypothetical protein
LPCVCLATGAGGGRLRYCQACVKVAAELDDKGRMSPERLLRWLGLALAASVANDGGTYGGRIADLRCKRLA